MAKTNYLDQIGKAKDEQELNAIETDFRLNVDRIWPERTQFGQNPEELSILNQLGTKRKAFQQQQASDKQLSIEEQVQAEVAKRQEANLQKKLDEIFGRVEQSGMERINQEFIPARIKTVNEEAALGRLTSPASIMSLSRIDEQRNKAMGNLFGNIASQKASGQFDTTKTIEAILAGEKDAERRSRDLQSELGFRRESLNAQVGENEKDRALKRYLGQTGMADDLSKYLGLATGVVGLGTGLAGKGEKGGLFR